MKIPNTHPTSENTELTKTSGQRETRQIAAVITCIKLKSKINDLEQRLAEREPCPPSTTMATYSIIPDAPSGTVDMTIPALFAAASAIVVAFGG
jgi:hypothetical protein